MCRHRSVALFLCAAVVLSACGKHADTAAVDATAADHDSDVVLPKPQAKGGPVTGMPATPGPNPVGPALAEAASADTDVTEDGDEPEDIEELDLDDATPDDDTADGAAMTISTEPSPQDAVAVLRDYYGAINQHDYQRAWASWSDGGRSSGQTPQQFADGFAGTVQVTLQAGAPGPVEGAAGSRYIEIPVTIDAAQRDGSIHHYAGTYTLRRAMVDGATQAQRAWHIASASLRETGQ
jgi:hypothetical protein